MCINKITAKHIAIGLLITITLSLILTFCGCSTTGGRGLSDSDRNLMMANPHMKIPN